jgi:hypothetical protein
MVPLRCKLRGALVHLNGLAGADNEAYVGGYNGER